MGLMLVFGSGLPSDSINISAFWFVTADWTALIILVSRSLLCSVLNLRVHPYLGPGSPCVFVALLVFSSVTVSKNKLLVMGWQSFPCMFSRCVCLMISLPTGVFDSFPFSQGLGLSEGEWSVPSDEIILQSGCPLISFSCPMD